MNTDPIRIIGAVLLYLIIFGSGVWLTRSGKPYSTLLLTLHKLISLAAVALLVIVLVQVHRATGLRAAELAAGVVTGALFLGTMATGGMLSIDKPMPAIILTLHKVTPLLTVVATAATLFLVRGR